MKVIMPSVVEFITYEMRIGGGKKSDLQTITSTLWQKSAWQLYELFLKKCILKFEL